MDGLGFAWSIALIVTAGTLPAGMVRALAYRSGSTDHTPGMRTVAVVVLTVGLVGLVCLLGLSVAMLER
jgi:hypothetical protein